MKRVTTIAVIALAVFAGLCFAPRYTDASKTSETSRRTPKGEAPQHSDASDRVSNARVAMTPTSVRSPEVSRASIKENLGDQKATGLLVNALAGLPPELRLPIEERERVIEHILVYLEVFNRLAAQHLKETSFDGNTLLLHIGAFPEKGEALHRKLYSDLSNRLGEVRAEGIIGHLRETIDQMFRGYGMAEQEIKVNRTSENSFRIEWRATVVDHLQGSWGGDSGGHWVSATGTATATFEEIQTGQWKALAERINSRYARSNA